MVDWVISHSDVLKHPDYGRATLETILHSYGMDVDRPYEDDYRWQKALEQGDVDEESLHGFTHRSLFTGEVCLGPRYTGHARQDNGWRHFVSDFLELRVE